MDKEKLFGVSTIALWDSQSRALKKGRKNGVEKNNLRI